MNTYIVFYNGLKRELVANSSYEAQQLAAKLLKVKPKFAYRIAIVLAEKDGQAVAVDPATL